MATLRRRRIRRVLRWGGTVLSVGIAVVWAFSFRWTIYHFSVAMEDFTCEHGAISLSVYHAPASEPWPGTSSIVIGTETSQYASPIRTFPIEVGIPDTPPATVEGWFIVRRAWNQDRLWAPSVYRDAYGSTLWIPIWIPLLSIVLPTAILWCRDRRAPLGHCQRCGYDLTGNMSGVCPECGEAVPGHEASDSLTSTTEKQV